ncbi:SAC3/GANP/Nin1/mts3/eIF-3 p25 family-domain-containing protein, partial [Dimargaris cristalligena]
MCPYYEQVSRQNSADVDRLELDPQTGAMDPNRAVKAFARSTAGKESELPSDVRPPSVLLRTLNYLTQEFLGSEDTLLQSYNFMRDRTRAIRQDLTLQNSRGREAVEINEQIARYHIIALHTARQKSGFNFTQELEQLEKVLTSLREFYEDLRAEGIACPNEPEFTAYYILVSLFQCQSLTTVQALPRQIFMAPIVQLALDLHGCAQYSHGPTHKLPWRISNCQSSPFLFRRFFKLLQSDAVPYLMACVVEINLPVVRRNILHALNRSIQHNPGHEHSTETMRTLLGLDSISEVVKLCNAHGI